MLLVIILLLYCHQFLWHFNILPCEDKPWHHIFILRCSLVLEQLCAVFGWWSTQWRANGDFLTLCWFFSCCMTIKEKSHFRNYLSISGVQLKIVQKVEIQPTTKNYLKLIHLLTDWLSLWMSPCWWLVLSNQKSKTHAHELKEKTGKSSQKIEFLSHENTKSKSSRADNNNTVNTWKQFPLRFVVMLLKETSQKTAFNRKNSTF